MKVIIIVFIIFLIKSATYKKIVFIILAIHSIMKGIINFNKSVDIFGINARIYGNILINIFFIGNTDPSIVDLTIDTLITPMNVSKEINNGDKRSKGLKLY